MSSSSHQQQGSMRRLPQAIRLLQMASLRSSSSTCISAALEEPLKKNALVRAAREAVAQAQAQWNARDVSSGIRTLRLFLSRYASSDDRLGQILARNEPGDKLHAFVELRRALDHLLAELSTEVQGEDDLADYFLVFRPDRRRKGWRVTPFFPDSTAHVACSRGDYASPASCTEWASAAGAVLDITVRDETNGMHLLSRPPADYDGVYQQEVTQRDLRFRGRPVYRRTRALTAAEIAVFDDDLLRASTLAAVKGRSTSIIAAWRRRRRRIFGFRRTGDDNADDQDDERKQQPA